MGLGAFDSIQVAISCYNLRIDFLSCTFRLVSCDGAMQWAMQVTPTARWLDMYLSTSLA